MELAKLFVAVGISFMLFLFLNSATSAVYQSPKTNYTECSSSSLSSCGDIIDTKCGATNWTCRIEATDSQEYKTCIANERGSSARCLERQTSKLENYMIIYYLILAFLGIVFIIIGFLIISKESVASGFIGGGVLNLLLAYLFAAIASFTSLLTGSLSSLTGAAVSTSKTPTISYLNILFSFIGLVVLILFALFKLERREDKENKETLYRQEPPQVQRQTINPAARLATGLYQTRPMPV